MKKRNSVITIIVLVVVVLLAIFLFSGSDEAPSFSDDEPTATSTATSSDDATSNDDTADETDEFETQSVIGTSVEGRDIVAYKFGNFGSGDTELLFVGGIHGGYSWSTSLLSYELISYFQDNPDAIPEDVSVTVIPALNPDGLAAVTGVDGEFEASDVNASQEERVAARFNANNVDLNRNFACNWSDTATWQSRSVDPGDGAFSEPEAQAIRSYIDANTPHAAVVYYASAGAVYSSSCNGGASSETDALMNVYADTSGYPAAGLFTAYAINGDMVNWMAKEGIPAISVLLSNHANAETTMNLAGVKALLDLVAPNILEI
ncbi:MAG: M14 family zinc carboxypeptidase [Candidatus Paceibacterota bacterium]